MNNKFLPNDAVTVDRQAEESSAQALARSILNPETRHAHTASAFAGRAFDGLTNKPGIGDFAGHVAAIADTAASGNLTLASRMLTAQALSLDTIFTEFSRLAFLNIAAYPDAADRFARLALKAQNNCRATLETLARLHQPREQTVRHVHVNQGSQAVVADHFHHHANGGANAESGEQCHATTPTGASTPLSGADALG